MKLLAGMLQLGLLDHVTACQVTNAMPNCYCEDDTLICKTIKTEWQGKSL